MNSIWHVIVLVLLFAAGGVLTYLAKDYEEENPMASVHLFTPNQWSQASGTHEIRVLRSPAITGDLPLDSAHPSLDSLKEAFRNLPVVPVDTLRWRLCNECCAFDLQYPVRLQSSALLQTIARQGAGDWAVIVPDAHLSTWRRILNSNPRIELYPKM